MFWGVIGRFVYWILGAFSCFWVFFGCLLVFLGCSWMFCCFGIFGCLGFGGILRGFGLGFLSGLGIVVFLICGFEWLSLIGLWFELLLSGLRVVCIGLFAWWFGVFYCSFVWVSDC